MGSRSGGRSHRICIGKSGCGTYHEAGRMGDIGDGGEVYEVSEV